MTSTIAHDTNDSIALERESRQTLRTACPSWCATHVSVDQGHIDEAVIHRSRRRRAGGQQLHLQRWDRVASSRAGRVDIVLDDEFLTRPQAKARSEALVRLAALLVAATEGDL